MCDSKFAWLFGFTLLSCLTLSVSGGFITDIGLRTGTLSEGVEKAGTKMIYTCSCHIATRFKDLFAFVLWRVQV
jgi:hypothetical protein